MPPSVELVCVNPIHVPEIWPHVSHLIRSAVLRGPSDWREIEISVLTGKHLLWLAWGSEAEAAATTELSVANGRKVCTIVACGGADRSRWLPLIAEIESYAKSEGCAAMHILGRKGWRRVLNGYAEKLVLLEKELT